MNITIGLPQHYRFCNRFCFDEGVGCGDGIDVHIIL